MKYQIIPSVIAKNQSELDRVVKKLKSLSPVLQLDVMDGEFVSSKSLDFSFNLPKHEYEAHLMIENPEVWLLTNKNIKTIIAHIETVSNPLQIIKIARRENKKIFFAINPATSVSRIKKYIKKIDGVLVMTVNPGKYGSKFIPGTLYKVKKIREMSSKIDIEVDGGMNPFTVKLAKEAGANRFVVGSYLVKARNAVKAMKELKKALN